MTRGIDIAIQAAGSQTALARAINKTQQAVSNWARITGRIPAEYVPDVERATGVPRHLLRPDLYELPQIGGAK